MAESENSTAFFGNRDTNKSHPLKKRRDLSNYIIKGTPVKRVQVGKQFKTVSFDDSATVRQYLPEDYEKLERRDFFNKNSNVSYTVLHDPTEPLVEEKPEPKRKRRTQAEIEEDELAAQIAAEEANKKKGVTNG